jgi:membrane dipeptidase
MLAMAIYAVAMVLPRIADATLNGIVTAQRPFVNAVHLQDRVRELHSSLFVVDCHADSLLWSRRPLTERVDRGHVDVPRLLLGNVALQFFTIVTSSPVQQNMIRNPAPSGVGDTITLLSATQGWGWAALSSKTERALAQCAQLHSKAADSNGTLVVLQSAADLDAFVLRHSKAPPRSIVAGVLGVEGMHIDGKLDNIDRLWRAGVRMFGITHFFDTPLAGSAHGEVKGGLTDIGRQAIARVVELGGIIDIAHASPATIDDVFALELRGLRVMASHAGVRGVCDNVRNLRDSDIVNIARLGGVLAVGFFEPTVCGESHIESIIQTIKYVVQKVGNVNHVALGSDFDGAVKVPFDASEMIILTQLLVNHQFTDSEIARVMGGNVRDMLAEHWASRK